MVQRLNDSESIDRFQMKGNLLTLSFLKQN